MSDFIHGEFISEIKNRFLCLVRIEGEETLCYVPSSSRLSNFLPLEGKQVLLKPTIGNKTRTEYAVYAVKFKKGYILLNLSEANSIVERQLFRRCFSFLGARKQISKEKSIEGYKSDLFIHDTNTIVEIKSLLTTEKTGMFPTVHSDRAIEQLQNIYSLLCRGFCVCYIFVSMNPYVELVKINPEISEYYRFFGLCMEKGMRCMGVSVKLYDNGPCIYKTINVEW